MIELIKTNVGNFYGYSNDYLFSELKKGNIVENNIIDFIQNNLNKDSVCIEIGANIGCVSITLSKNCKKLYCLEPQNNIYLALCANLFINECYNAEPIKAAAFYKKTQFSFAPKQKQDPFVGNYESGFDSTNSFGSISLQEDLNGDIKAIKIDDLIEEKVHFIKSDAEGGDLSALMGCEKIIKTSKPIIIFEFHSKLSQECYNQSWGDYIEFFNRMNYNVSKFDEANFIAKSSE